MAKRAPGSQSAGYHYNATPKNPAPTKTPTVASSPSQAAKGPAGDYRGASADYVTAVEALPPKAQAVTEKATLRASRRRVRAQRRKVRALTPPKTPKAQKALKRVRSKKYQPPKLPSTKPVKFEGKPTAGTPTLKSLQVAKKTGTLRVNKRGFATTPPVRAAARELKKAKLVVKKSGPKIAGPLTHGQKVFAKRVAAKTALSPRVVAAQALAEESGSAAAQREAEGNQNWLNIGMTDSGPISLTQDRAWSHPKSAADATVAFLKGKKYGASPGIQAILPESKGKSDKGQIAAIAHSGWATNPDYQSSIEGTHALVSAKPGNPKATKRLAKAKVKAEKVGLDVGKPSSHVGPAPKKVVTRFKAAKRAMKEVEGLPYVWGGGHGSATSSPTGGGLDCSGAVGYVLNKIHAMKGSLTSGDMGSVLKPGPGALTVFYNGEHTFLRLGNEYWGTSVGDSGAGGLGPHPAPSAGYLASYSVGHVAGLGKKQALQLGFKNLGEVGTQSFPGMTLSSSGTTATIDSGAGATVGKPGFSSKPIQLTPVQEARRKLHKLDQLGVEAGTPTTQTDGSAPSTSELSRLEQKYSGAAA